MKTFKHYIANFSILFSSFFTYGQIDLGTASNFVLFTGIGAFDNSGTSTFLGDIGTNAGVISGFPPGIVTGQMYQENSATAQGITDLEVAYNYMTGIPCDSVIGSALGGGQILKTNVYCINAAATLGGTLILDGENDPNALFIIKIEGILDVNAMAKVSLINSALIRNVFWQINGAINVADSAIIKGIFVANGALSFADGSVLDGNALTKQGAITTIRMNATLPTDFAMQTELLQFEAITKQDHNLLTWATASENNNNYFTLERSINGIDFMEITRMNGAGMSTTKTNYTFADFEYEKTQNYYRLSQTDYDGTTEIFKVIAVNNASISLDIIRMVNMLGQEVAADDIGLRVIYFSNGTMKKVLGKHIQ